MFLLKHFISVVIGLSGCTQIYRIVFLFFAGQSRDETVGYIV